jgi:orotidine-5'-phosphate decarboxylase
MTKNLIFSAIDTADLARAAALARQLAPHTGIKLGLEFFSSHGTAGVKDVMKAAGKAPLFLDLKFHDIPNTVAGAVRAACAELKPAYLNVHAQGGAEMMTAARKACTPDTKLLAVTVLTSLDDDGLSKAGQKMPARELVHHLAILAKECGLDGVVCSAHEIESLRRVVGKDFILMVPGIRPQGVDHADQKRVMTPKEAIQAGATHLVIGRPITESSDPARAAQDILTALNQ